MREPERTCASVYVAGLSGTGARRRQVRAAPDGADEGLRPEAQPSHLGVLPLGGVANGTQGPARSRAELPGLRPARDRRRPHRGDARRRKQAGLWEPSKLGFQAPRFQVGTRASCSSKAGLRPELGADGSDIWHNQAVGRGRSALPFTISGTRPGRRHPTADPRHPTPIRGTPRRGAEKAQDPEPAVLEEAGGGALCVAVGHVEASGAGSGRGGWGRTHEPTSLMTKLPGLRVAPASRFNELFQGPGELPLL